MKRAGPFTRTRFAMEKRQDQDFQDLGIIRIGAVRWERTPNPENPANPCILEKPTTRQTVNPGARCVKPLRGLETRLVTELAAAGLPAVVVNPRQVREFARATGRLAKTDRLDAQVLAQFGAALRPPVRPLPDAAQRELQALVSRRRQLVTMQTQERNRRRQVSSELVVAQIDDHLELLGRQVAQLDQDIAALLQDHAVWQTQAKLLRSIPGVGPVLVSTLIAQLPELGHARPGAIAALAGVAPYNRDRGQWRGKRSVWGGRRQLRAALYMATLAATRSITYSIDDVAVARWGAGRRGARAPKRMTSRYQARADRSGRRPRARCRRHHRPGRFAHGVVTLPARPGPR